MKCPCCYEHIVAITRAGPGRLVFHPCECQLVRGSPKSDVWLALDGTDADRRAELYRVYGQWLTGRPVESGGGGGTYESESIPHYPGVRRSARSWAELRRTWIETGDLSVLQEMSEFPATRMTVYDLDPDAVIKTPIQDRIEREHRRAMRMCIAIALLVILAYLASGVLDYLHYGGF